jgi:hypothetical protein
LEQKKKLRDQQKALEDAKKVAAQKGPLSKKQNILIQFF